MALCVELANDEKPINIRQLAGLCLKNQIFANVTDFYLMI